MFSLERLIAKIRLHYHANCLDINNALNQMHLMSDEKNEESNKKHVMIIFTDVCPRLGVDIFKEKKEAD